MFSDSEEDQDGEVEEEEEEVENKQAECSQFQQELGISGGLVEGCLGYFSILYGILSRRSDELPTGVIESLREEFRKFYVWNDVRGTQQGHLEQVLSTSRSLRVAVLSLLVQWARLLCKGRF